MRRIVVAAIMLAVFVFSGRAYGLFEVKHPLSGEWKIYEVAIGTVESTRDTGHVFTVKLTSVPREAPPKRIVQDDASTMPATSPASSTPAGGFVVGDQLAIQVGAPDELWGRIVKDHPIVIIRSGIKDIVINIADDWYLARPGNTPKILRIVSVLKDYRGTFPGHTTDLLQVLEELKAGKYTLLDECPPRMLGEQVRIGAVPSVKDVAAIAASRDEKGRTLVYIRTSEGALVYQLKDGVLAKGVDEAAQKEFISKHVISAEKMEKNPLFKKSFSVTKGAFGADGSQAVLAVRAEGLVRVTDGDKSAAGTDDDVCLLGSKLSEHITEWSKGITDGVISTCDVNGDGRDDAVIVSSKGSLLLLNRGFGVFLVVKADGDAFKGALAATADPVSGGLLVLKNGENGAVELWRVSMSKP